MLLKEHITFGKLTKKKEIVSPKEVLKLSFLTLLRIFHLESNMKPLQDIF